MGERYDEVFSRYRSDNDALEAIVTELQDLGDLLARGLTNLINTVSEGQSGRGFDAEAFETLGSDKTKKGMKQFDGILKGFGKGAGQFSIFSAILEGLSPLLEPLAIILDLVSMLFSQLAAGILQSLIPALEPLFQMFIDMGPVFYEVGVQIGELLSSGISKLMTSFGDMDISIGDLFNAIEPLIDVFIDLVEIGWGVLITSLRTIVPLIQTLGIVLDAIGPAIELITMAFGTGLITVIYGIGYAIAVLMDIFAPLFGGEGGNAAAWEAEFEPVFDGLRKMWNEWEWDSDFGSGVTTTEDDYSGTALSDLGTEGLGVVGGEALFGTWTGYIPTEEEIASGTLMAAGGVTVSPVTATIGEKGNEVIMPYREMRFAEQESELIAINEKLEYQNQLLRKQQRQLSRRRFG